MQHKPPSLQTPGSRLHVSGSAVRTGSCGLCLFSLLVLWDASSTRMFSQCCSVSALGGGRGLFWSRCSRFQLGVQPGPVQNSVLQGCCRSFGGSLGSVQSLAHGHVWKIKHLLASMYLDSAAGAGMKRLSSVFLPETNSDFISHSSDSLQ